MAPRTKTQMSAETTARLLAAARAAFAAEGYAGVAMETLTGDLGLTRGALYHHFGGKEGLFEAVVRALDAEIGARLEAVWEAIPDPRAALSVTCRAWLALARDPQVRQILLRDAPAVLGPAARSEDRAAAVTALTEAVEAIPAAAPRDAEAIARILNAALTDLALWIAESETPETTLARAERATDDLLAGLGLDG